MNYPILQQKDRKEIADILNRRANEIAGYKSDFVNDPKHYGSVELALTREIERLRNLATKIYIEKDAD